MDGNGQVVEQNMYLTLNNFLKTENFITMDSCYKTQKKTLLDWSNI